MANNNSRPIISLNGVVAAALLLALLMWGFRTVLLNDLGISTHAASDEEHAAAEVMMTEEPAAPAMVEQPVAIVPQMAEVSETTTGFSPDGYVAFDQAAYQQVAAAGVNWQADYQAPDFNAARSDGAAAPVQMADSSSDETDSSDGADEPAGVTGDAEAGGKLAKKKCRACHNFGEGEKHKTGPTLFGVVGRVAGTAEGYTKYSNDLKDWGGEWTAENLDTFLTKPKAMFKKTRMSFAGFKKEQDRADVIAYLESLSAD